MRLRNIVTKEEVKPFDWIKFSNGEDVQVIRWEDPKIYSTGKSSLGIVYIEHYGHTRLKFPVTLGLEFF